MSQNILPDSRTQERRGAVVDANGVSWVPIYCVNCGRSCGVVPEKHITNVTALCDHGCSGKYGDLASTYKDPDAVFRENLGEALSPLGRQVTVEELEALLEDRSPALAAAVRDWQRHASKENR